MNEAALKMSIIEGEKLLSEAGILKEKNTSRYFDVSPKKFSQEFFQISQEDNYIKIYETAIKNGDYDLLLNDDSIIQFSCEINSCNQNLNKYRYAFFQNPRKYPTYEEFLRSMLNESIQNCGDMFMSDYEQVVSEAELNEGVCPFRYDYDYSFYKGIVHPISHIHIGHNNNVRIGVDKVLTPEKFVVFILINSYYKIWKDICKNNEELKKKCLESKLRCSVIQEYINSEEKKLLLLR